MLTAEESFRKHPFFSSPEELEEEYYDEQMPEKKRRLTQEQVRYQFVPFVIIGIFDGILE